MDLQILGVFDKNTSRERLTLRVLEDCNCGDYIVMDTTYNENGEKSNVWRHALHLPNLKVCKGDQIKIYTRSGLQRTVKSKQGNNLHFVFWGLSGSIWNNSEDIAYLYKISDSESKTIENDRMLKI